MFCRKCGKPNDDDAQFCEFCGAPFKKRTPPEQTASTAVQQPIIQPTATPAPKKRRKGGVIAAVISVASVAVAAVIVIFVLNKHFAPKDAPSPTGSPTMTVNGKDIPVSLAVMGSDDEYTMIEIAGKADNELFGVLIGFSETLPQSGTKINSSEDYDNCEVVFQHAGSSTGVTSDGYYRFAEIDADSFSLEVKEYVPNSSIELQISVRRDDGETFELRAGGRIEFRANYVQEGDNWLNRNRIPAANNTNHQAAPTAPTQPAAADEITIKGRKYSTDLTVLDLSGQGLESSDIAELKHMTKLKQITLNDNYITDISVLGNIPTLEEVDANNNQISNISCFGNLPRLKIVVMNNNDIQDISVFSNFTTVEKIWLHYNNITDISPISGNKQLTELGFDGNPIRDISAVKGMYNLRMLCVNGCGITDISALEGIKSLDELNIGNNSISDLSVLDGIKIEMLTV